MKKKILIGWSSRDITPERKVSLRGQFHIRISEKVNDRLTATALALETEDASEQAIIVSMDAALVPDVTKEACRDILAKQLPDFDVKKLLMHGTHTHSAPGQAGTNFADPPLGDDIMSESGYSDFLVEKVCEAACEAWSRRKAGALSWGRGHAVVGFNRRLSYFDGSSVMYGKSDDPDFSHVEGYEDHGVDMLFTYDENHDLTGMVVNVPCPSQCTEQSYFISADYWHETRQEIRKRHGDKLYILPQCATAGDQSPRTLIDRRADERMMRLKGYENNLGYGSDYDVMRRQDIAEKIAKAVDEVLPLVKQDIRDEVEFSHETAVIKLEQRKPSEEDLEAVKQEIIRCRKKLEELKDTDPASRDYSITYKTKIFNERAVKMYEAHEHGQGFMDVELHVMRLGDVAFCSNPFELYVDYGVRIKARSKAVQTFLIQLAGSGSYLPSERAMKGGGYGAFITSTPVWPSGGQEIVEKEISLINNMFIGK